VISSFSPNFFSVYPIQSLGIQDMLLWEMEEVYAWSAWNLLLWILEIANPFIMPLGIFMKG